MDYSLSIVGLANSDFMDQRLSLSSSMVLQRVKEYLETDIQGRHPADAGTRVFQAFHELDTYNIAQSSVISSLMTKKDRAQLIGESIISISNGSPHLRLTEHHHAWLGLLASSIGKLFSVKSIWKEASTDVSVMFGGIAGNTAVAALAFQSMYVSLREKGATYPGADDYCLGFCDNLPNTVERVLQDQLDVLRAKDPRTALPITVS